MMPRYRKEEHQMKLKVSEQSNSGLNTKFVNVETGRTFTAEHVIEQINKGNPNYDGYHTVYNSKTDTTYVRSNPDGKKNNNIE